MPASSKRPLSRDRAWACVTLNFSLSGWGTLKAGRIFSGLSQLVTAFGGFFLLLAWMFKWIYRIFQTQIGQTLSPPPPDWLWKWGIGCFVLSYTWMLLSCVSLMWQAKAPEEKNRQNVPPRLTDLPYNKPPEIQSALAALPDWKQNNSEISRTFQFKDFPAAMKFVNAVAELAEAAQHHPDIDIRWNQVRLALTTHDAGGLTKKDFALAQQFDALSLQQN